MSSWSEACQKAKSRPQSQLEQANYGGCLFAVISASPARPFPALRVSVAHPLSAAALFLLQLFGVRTALSVSHSITKHLLLAATTLF